MIEPHHEACVLILAWEWWLGHQRWLKAKSTIALLVLIVTVIIVWLYTFIKGDINDVK